VEAAKGIHVLEHPPYWPDLAPADFSLFGRVKEALAGIMLDQESLKNAWEGITRIITTGDYTTAFRRWFEQTEKCFRIGGDFVEKSKEIKIVLPPTVVFLLIEFGLFGRTPRKG
jgi:hypothetical protein